MPQSNDPLDIRILGALGVVARPAASIASDLDASRPEVQRILDELVADGAAKKVGVMYRKAPDMGSPSHVLGSGVTSTVSIDAPKGIERLRAILRFHADIQEELASSKFVFDPSDNDDKKALRQSLRKPFDWHALDTQGVVRIANVDLPQVPEGPGYFRGHGLRYYLCGPLELVETSRRGESKKRWMPVFVQPVRAKNDQYGVSWA